jgi:hypothetical protein
MMGLSRGYICAMYTHDQNIHIIITPRKVRHHAILRKELAWKMGEGRGWNLHSVVAGEGAVLRGLMRVLADDARRDQEEHCEDDASIDEAGLL